ncbi:MAG: DUF6502 family protein [Pseudomonadota bacterium]
MSDHTKQKLINLLFRALRPLIHLLIESGLGHREFSEIAKRAYVDVASKNYGIRGRDTNISRVAVMTGLTRKEVKRIRDELNTPEGTEMLVKQLPPSIILQQWHTDPDFMDKNGTPRALNFSDESPSFFALVRKYAGDIPAGALRTELKRAGAIDIAEDGSLTVLRRDYRIVDADEQFLWALSRTVYASIANASHNYFVRRYPDRTKEPPWPSRIVEVTAIDEKLSGRALEIVAKEATLFSERVDDALIELADTGESAGPDAKTINVGLVYVEGDRIP